MMGSTFPRPDRLQHLGRDRGRRGAHGAGVGVVDLSTGPCSHAVANGLLNVHRAFHLTSRLVLLTGSDWLRRAPSVSYSHHVFDTRKQSAVRAPRYRRPVVPTRTGGGAR